MGGCLKVKLIWGIKRNFPFPFHWLQMLYRLSPQTTHKGSCPQDRCCSSRMLRGIGGGKNTYRAPTVHQSLCRVFHRYEISNKSTTTLADRSSHAHLQLEKQAQKGHLNRGGHRVGSSRTERWACVGLPQLLAAGTILLAALLLSVLSTALRDRAYLVSHCSPEQEMRSWYTDVPRMAPCSWLPAGSQTSPEKQPFLTLMGWRLASVSFPLLSLLALCAPCCCVFLFLSLSVSMCV